MHKGEGYCTSASFTYMKRGGLISSELLAVLVVSTSVDDRTKGKDIVHLQASQRLEQEEMRGSGRR